ncbi:thioredoxin [Candidatus Dojkabacteria bacterium]|nr:thioredoxin [Candidatus Dojkabacteria bacterium]
MAHLVLTDDNFKEEVEDHSGVVLVDFWAAWCMPCQMLGPVIGEIAEEMNNAKIGKLNVDENPKIAGEHQVMSIPTVKIFKDGEVVETLVGVQPKEAYIEAIKKHQ